MNLTERHVIKLMRRELNRWRKPVHGITTKHEVLSAAKVDALVLFASFIAADLTH